MSGIPSFPQIFFLFLAGMGFGLFYFSGLWLTLRKLANRRSWTIWLGISFILRLAVVLCGFFLLMQENWIRLVVLTMGFLVTRTLMIKRINKISTSTGQKTSKP